MHILIETTSGYGLFKLKDGKIIESNFEQATQNNTNELLSKFVYYYIV